MAKYVTAGLDVNDKILMLCRRWGTEEVLQQVKDWAAYMDKQIATSQRYFDHHDKTVQALDIDGWLDICGYAACGWENVVEANDA